MRISIITPAFNSAKTIADTVESIKQQVYGEIEHIVVDGASKDATLQILRSLDARVSIISEPDNGIYDAMNKGIRHASGEIIGILNSDDYYRDEQALEKVAQVFNAENCDALYADLIYVDCHNKERIVRTWRAGAYDRRKFLNGWMPPHPTFFVRKDIYTEYGLYDETLKTSADYEMMLRLLYKHQISVAYLPECLVCMRTGGQSNATLRHRLQANREDRLAWKKNGLDPRFYTTWLKPIRKLPQFIK